MHLWTLSRWWKILAIWLCVSSNSYKTNPSHNKQNDCWSNHCLVTNIASSFNKKRITNLHSWIKLEFSNFIIHKVQGATRREWVWQVGRQVGTCLFLLARTLVVVDSNGRWSKLRNINNNQHHGVSLDCVIIELWEWRCCHNPIKKLLHGVVVIKHFVWNFQLGSYNLVSHIGQVEKKWVPTNWVKAFL
jgi:hypothetical protein